VRTTEIGEQLHRGAGYPAAERTALEALADAEKNLRAVSAWASQRLVADLTGDPAPQAISDCWRDYALTAKRAVRRWEKAQGAVLEVLDSGGTAS